MQDNEFDELFQSKLDGFEMEPSAQVWENIHAELDGKRKKSIFPALRIAASVIILVTAGILFIPKKDTTKPLRQPKNGLASNHAATPRAVKPAVNAPAVAPVIIKSGQSQNPVAANTIAAAHRPARQIRSTVKTAKQPATIIEKQEPVKPEEPQMIAAVGINKPAEIAQPVVPGPETQLIAKSSTDEIVTAPKPLLATQPAETVQPKPKRRGIRNFGDLVNLVVAKVDKRKDKMIEFTDTDDDESTITGVNMGPIKLKKDK